MAQEHMEVWLQGGYDADTNHEYVRLNTLNRGRALMCMEIIHMFEELTLPEPQQEQKEDEFDEE
jgi:hypothetical protein